MIKLLNKEVKENVVVFKMPQEVELSNSYDVKEHIYKESFEAGFKYLVLDFSQTQYLDSSGLGIIVAIHKQARLQGGAVVLVGLDSNIKNLLKFTALDRVLTIYDSVESAFEFFKK